ncbi:MAG TPA: PEPxxWA-CTERM sorting domain-containing protein [Sphingobium sp.]|nr:PEPxxWA-CTERM sorting domain-containing protein [Sphingobium sp.]
MRRRRRALACLPVRRRSSGFWSGDLTDPWTHCGLSWGTATPGVPEPATWAMLMGGFALAGVAMRRRKVALSFA